MVLFAGYKLRQDKNRLRALAGIHLVIHCSFQKQRQTRGKEQHTILKLILEIEIMIENEIIVLSDNF